MQDVPKIVLERLKAAAPALDHPEADLLTAFAEQSLPAPERTTVLAHLARCSDCREIVAIALPVTEAGAAASIPARSRWLTWPALRWGLVAAGIVIIATLGTVQYRRTGAPSIALNKAPGIATPEQRVPSSVPATAPPAANSDKNETARPSADSLSTTTGPVLATNEPNMEAKSIARSTAGSASARQSYHGGTGGGFISGSQNSHGPKMPAQWQNNNNFQLQSSSTSPGPPPPQSAAGSIATRIAPASPTPTAEAGGEADSGLDTLAQNKEMQVLPKADPSELIKAKPAEPATAAISSGPASGPGQIGGYVVDPTGAAVSNARITVTGAGTGQSITAVTNSQGAWLIAGLPTGNYRAQADAPGFRTSVLNLDYDASQPSAYRFTLDVGSVSETVMVSAADGQVQTDDAVIASASDPNAINKLPLNGRNVTELTSLSPGLANGSLPRWTISSVGVLQRSLDQGRTWQTVDVTASSAAASRLELAANQSVAKQKSADRKALRKQPAAPTFRVVAAAGANVWAGGSGGALYHSLDAGDTWLRVQPSSNGSILTGDIVSLDFPDSQHGKIATATSEVWTTTDAGQSWQKQ